MPSDSQPTMLPTALQPLNVALAEIANTIRTLTSVTVAGQQSLKGLQDEVKDAAEEGKKAEKTWAQLKIGLSAAASMATLAADTLGRLTGAISNQMGAFVKMYSPVAMIRFGLAVDDLNAAIGRAILPTFEKMTSLVRALGDGISSLSGPAKTLLAGTLAAAVGITVMTAAVFALDAALNLATAGLPAIIAAVVGGLGGLAFAMKDMAAVQGPLMKLWESGVRVFDAVGAAAAKLFVFLAPAAETLFGVIGKAFEFLANAAGPAVEAMTPLFQLLGAVGQSIGQLVAAVAPALMQLFKSVAAMAGATLPILGTLAGAFTSILGGLTQVTGAILQAVSPLIHILATVLAPVLKVLALPFAILANVLAVVAAGVGKVLGFFGTLLAPLASSLTKVVDAMTELWGTLGPLADKFLADIGKALVALGESLWEAFKPVGEFIGGVLIGVVQELAEWLQNLAVFIKQVAKAIHAMFGLPEPDEPSPVDRQRTNAVRNARYSSTEDVYKEAVRQAFMSGSGTQSVEQQMVEVMKRLTAQMEAANKLMTEQIRVEQAGRSRPQPTWVEMLQRARSVTG